MQRVLALLVVLLVSATASAQSSTAPAMRIKKLGTSVASSESNFRVLSAVPASASAALRTAEVIVAGYSKLSTWIDVTEGGTITAVVATCSASPNMGTTYGQINSTSVAAGAGTVTAYADTYALTTSGVVLLEYDVRTYDKFKCVISLTGGGATDTFHVLMTAAVGQ